MTELGGCAHVLASPARETRAVEAAGEHAAKLAGVRPLDAPAVAASL